VFKSKKHLNLQIAIFY